MRLTNGQVLVVGDDHECLPGGALPGMERAEVYDPVANRWTEVGSLNKPRKTPATVALSDGSALVMGGINPDDVSFSSTKRFEVDSGTWSDGPLMNLARGMPLAVGLADGRVLVASADGGVDFSPTVEILDRTHRFWSRAASPGAFTSLSHLTRLDDGKVLGIGSDSTDSEPVFAAWLFDPTANVWSGVSAPVLWPTHVLATPNGAITLGYSDESELRGGSGGPSSAVGSQFDRVAGEWTPIPMMPTPRFHPQAVVLTDGRILVAGGRDQPDSNGPESRIVTTAEVYDPATAAWSSTADLLTPRENGHAVLLADGSVLVFGGEDTLNVYGDTPFCPPGLTTVERFRLSP